MINTNIIINGNSLEELKKIPPNSIDLIFADPPYWMQTKTPLTRVDGTIFNGCDDDWDKFSSLNDYKNFTYSWLNACYNILKPTGSFWVIGSMQCIYTIGDLMQEIGFWFINDVIWQKSNPTPNFKGTRLNNSHETLIWATKDKKSKYTFNYKTAKELNTDTVNSDDYAKGIRKQLGSIWRIPICSGNERLRNENGTKLHTTQKPEKLLYKIIAISSKIGDTILDPFGGTMTTAAMAKKLGRKYIMIEQNATYCQIGQKRLETISFENNDIANATFDKKPLKVTMQEMIQNNAFINGEWFYSKTGNRIAQLCKNGKLLYNGQIIDMHACAAISRNSKAKRLNGFDYWYVKRNNALISISNIREIYREKKQSINS